MEEMDKTRITSEMLEEAATKICDSCPHRYECGHVGNPGLFSRLMFIASGQISPDRAMLPSIIILIPDPDDSPDMT